MLKTGITEKQIEQLIHYSNHDKAVAAYSSDPERFRDRKAFDYWLRTDKATIYTLSDREGNLLGIVWFHLAPFPDVELMADFRNLDKDFYNRTFGIRLYGQARGRGLAKKITAEAINTYNKQGIWLKVSHDNTAAVKTYKHFFTQVSDPDEKGKIVMAMDPLRFSPKS